MCSTGRDSDVVWDAAEIELAAYYLQERYNSQISSNFEELDYAVSRLERSRDSTETFLDINPSPFDPTEEDLDRLFGRVASNHYKAVEDDETDLTIFSNCLTLFKKDYEIEILKNEGGTLSWNYPCRIIIPVSETSGNVKTEYFFKRSRSFSKDSAVPAPFLDNEEKFAEFCELSKQASIARCRNRFPIPVIFYNGKFICRSATLAVKKGVAFGMITQPKEPQGEPIYDSSFQYVLHGVRNVTTRIVSRIQNTFEALLSDMNTVKDLDVKILTSLGIDIICDLMVEDRKIHTGMSVGSSEKVNLKQYGKFRTLSLPYPGCSFFKKYTTNQRKAEGLVYNWDEHDVTTQLGMINARDYFVSFQGIRWSQYKNWDLINLTKNVIKVLLHFFTQKEKTLLVHCISGWDRTPLFISLLRIALWANGLVHQNLNTTELAYLTLAYDWYLFGHNLPTRIKKGEEVMHFCFNFLPELIPDEYNMRAVPFGESERADKLRAVREVLLRIYDKYVQIGDD